MTCDAYICDLDPDTKTKIKIFLFKNVQNVEEIRNNIVKGVWNCAVIKPSLIVDPLQVVVAANRAVVARHQENMVTRTVYGEILYNLSLSKKITESLMKFGIEKSKELLICFLVTEEEDNSIEILPQIQGEQCSLSELPNMTNLKEVKKVYKLKDSEDFDLIDNIISRMVVKNFVSH